MASPVLLEPRRQNWAQIWTGRLWKAPSRPQQVRGPPTCPLPALLTAPFRTSDMPLGCFLSCFYGSLGYEDPGKLVLVFKAVEADT